MGFLSLGNWELNSGGNGAFPPSVALHANSLNQLQSCNWARSGFVFVAGDGARKSAAIQSGFAGPVL